MWLLQYNQIIYVCKVPNLSYLTGIIPQVDTMDQNPILGHYLQSFKSSIPPIPEHMSLE